MFRSLFVVALSLPAIAQSTWHVDSHASPGGDGSMGAPYASIQAAHDQAGTLDGDTLLVAPGLYDEHLTLTKDLVVRASAGPLETILRPTDAGIAVHFPNFPNGFSRGPELEGFTVVHPGTGGGATIVGRSGVVRRCIVDAAGAPQGIFARYDMWVEHSVVTGATEGVREETHNGFLFAANSIFAGNTLDLATPISNNAGLAYCCYQTSLSSAPSTNVVAAPQLFDLAGHDAHPTATSPCIDAGDPNAPLDPDGSRADIGALPFDVAWSPSTTYCTAKVNSQGCTPAIAAVGSASLTSTQPCTVTCVNELNNKTGLFFYGLGPRNTPYQGGYLCVASPLRRTPKMESGGNAGADDCSGAYSYELNELIQSGADPLLTPGVDVHGQFWSRDPLASFTTNRSDAIRLRILP